MLTKWFWTPGYILIKVPIICQILTKTEFHRQTSVQDSSIKFHENPSNVVRVVPHGRADILDEAKSSFPQICETQPKIDKRRSKASPTALTCLNRCFQEIQFELVPIKHWVTCRYHVGNLKYQVRGSSPLSCHGPHWQSDETSEPLLRKLYLNT